MLLNVFAAKAMIPQEFQMYIVILQPSAFKHLSVSTGCLETQEFVMRVLVEHYNCTILYWAINHGLAKRPYVDGTLDASP